MADLYVDSAGSNTAPYETEAKAANELDTALDYFEANSAALGDSVIHVAAGTYVTAFNDAGGPDVQVDLTIEPTVDGTYPTIPALTWNAQSWNNCSLTIKGMTCNGALSIDWGGNDLTIEDCSFSSGIGITQITGWSGYTLTLKNLSFYNVAGNCIGLFPGDQSTTYTVENCSAYNCTRFLQGALGAGTVNAKNNIFHTVTTTFDDLDGGMTVNSLYSDYYTVTNQFNGGGTFNTSNDYSGATAFDPQFVDPANGDLTLNSGSSAIDAGDPISSYGNEPYGGGGRINLGRWGNTSNATTASILPSISCSSPLPEDKVAGNIQVLATVTSSAISYANGCPTHAQCCINNGELVTMSHQGNGLFKGHIRTAGYPNGTGTLHIYVESTGIGGNTAHSGVLVDLSNVDYSADAKGAYIGDHIGKGTEGIVWVEGAEPRKVPSPKGYRHRNLKFGMRRS